MGCGKSVSGLCDVRGIMAERGIKYLKIKCHCNSKKSIFVICVFYQFWQQYRFWRSRYICRYKRKSCILLHRSQR